MKTCPRCGVEKDEINFYSGARKCKACCIIMARIYNLADPDRFQKKKAYRDKHKVAHAEYKRIWFQKNKASLREKRSETSKQWSLENPEKRRDISRRYWKRNPAKLCAHVGRYRARVIGQTPGWANAFFIEEIYDLAQRRSLATGVLWTVDHIVPLKHNLVCGLHCEQNMNVITKTENSKKHNRWWPDMPEIM